MPDDAKQYKTVDKYDRAAGSLKGRHDTTGTKPATVVAHTPVLNEAQTFIVETIRVKDEGDWIFVQYIDSEGSARIAFPPGVADAIARQRDALTTKNRKRAGREQAQARKARGELPGFMKPKKPKKK